MTQPSLSYPQWKQHQEYNHKSRNTTIFRLAVILLLIPISVVSTLALYAQWKEATVKAGFEELLRSVGSGGGGEPGR